MKQTVVRNTSVVPVLDAWPWSCRHPSQCPVCSLFIVHWWWRMREGKRVSVRGRGGRVGSSKIHSQRINQSINQSINRSIDQSITSSHLISDITSLTYLCAMVSTVDLPPPNSSLMVRWITLSVSKSTLEVASSKSKIRERRTKARAKHNSWENNNDSAKTRTRTRTRTRVRWRKDRGITEGK